MVQLWSCLLLVLASLCAVHTKPYPEAKHRALLRTGYHYFPGVGYYRIAYKIPEIWTEARRMCQQEGGTMAVVNSENEAEVLRYMYLNYGPGSVERDNGDENPPQEPTPTPEPVNATVRIGFHDRFIEGEYLTVRSEPLIMTGFVRWKVGHPIADNLHNCGAFDTGMFLLNIPCDEKLPYICEVPEAP